MDAVGFLELSSIAKGIEAADAILKAADVDLVLSNPTCPGKYSILFTGDVAAVSASLDAGKFVGDVTVIDSTIIPRIHPQVIKAMSIATSSDGINAIGIMEFFSITASVYAADAAVKAADVDLLEVRLGSGIGGKSFVLLTGEVSSVKASIDAGTMSDNAKGFLVSSVVIPRPHKQLSLQLL